MKRLSVISRVEADAIAREYEMLVDELMKDQPDQALVRRLMKKQGITYTQDPIGQLTLVLQAMSRPSAKQKDSVAL